VPSRIRRVDYSSPNGYDPSLEVLRKIGKDSGKKIHSHDLFPGAKKNRGLTPILFLPEKKLPTG
jgi:hypothetical protein